MKWAWVIFLLIGTVLFAMMEYHAIMTQQPTLSALTWELAERWPPLPWAVGVVMGFVACHLFWRKP